MGAAVACVQVDTADTDITELPGALILALTGTNGTTAATGSDDSGDGVTTTTITRTKYVYVTSRNDNTLGIFSFDNDTGVITATGASPYALGATQGPIGICMHPTMQYVYVAVRDANATRGFSIDSTSGNLTELGGSPYAGGSQPWDCEVTPDGNWLYTAFFGGGNSTNYFSISSGVPTLLGAVSTGGNTAQSLKVSGDGQYLFASHTNSTDISALSINPSTGALTANAGSPYAGGSFNRQIALSPNGDFAYVPIRNDNNMRIYSISGGVLSEIGVGSPQTLSGLGMGAAVSPDGNYVYVGEQTSNLVRIFSRDQSTGQLSPIGTDMPVSNPQTLYFEPGGKFLFVMSTAASANVIVFQYNSADGQLTHVTGSPFSFGNGIHQAAFVSETITQ